MESGLRRAEEEADALADAESDADLDSESESTEPSGDETLGPASVDVSSTLMTLGRAYGDLGTHSLSLNRMPGSDSELGDIALSESKRRYEQLRLLGRGGMGRVDQVWDQDLMRKLAIKRLHPERAESGHALRQFLWEARVTAHLDHPNIVPVHDLGMDEKGDIYFTMKFVHGTSLDEMLAALARVEQAAIEGTTPTPVDEIITAEHLTALRRVRLFLDLCQGIAFAHERGVLHRDLKPANVMIGQYGEVLIMDWGLAYPLPGPAGEGLRELLPDLILDGSPDRPTGTPRYMSPEQVAGRDLDERSDIYSLGVILYELLTLRSPYAATDFTRLMLQVSEGETLPITQTGPSVPDSLIHVVNRAMAHEPSQRYASVGELADDIEAVLDGAAPSLGPAASMVAAQLIVLDDDEDLGSDTAPSSTGAGVSVAHLALLLGSGLALGLALAALVGDALVASLGAEGLAGLGLALALGLAIVPLRAVTRG